MMLVFVVILQIFCCYSESEKGVDRVAFINCILRGEELFATQLKPIFISLPLSEQDLDDGSRITSHDLLVKGLTSNKKWPLILVNIRKGCIVTPKARRAATIHNYLIYFRHKGEFKQSLNSLENDQILNPHANFLVVSPTVFPNDKIIFEEIFNVLQEYDIINAVLLLGSSNDTSTFNLFSLMPFKDRGCKYSVKDVKLIDSCTNGTYKLETPWYSYKVPKLFKSCQLRVLYVEVPPYALDMGNITTTNQETISKHGLEVAIVTNIFGYMNVSLTFIKSEGIGEIYLNKTATGSLKVLLEKRADIALGGYAQSIERIEFFDCSFPYMFETLEWVVPHEHVAVAELFGMASIIKYEVWLAIVVLIALATFIIAWLAKRSYHERDMYKHALDTVQNVTLAVINLTIHLLPKSHGVRMIFSALLLFAFTYNAAYTTYLTSVLARADRSQEKFYNVVDIRRHNLGVYINPNSEKYFQINTTTDYVLVHKSITCHVKDYYSCLREVALFRNACFLVQGGFIKYAADNYLSSQKAHLLRILPRKVISYPLNFLMIKGFWGLERVNILLNNAVASGLADKWMEVPRNPKSNETVVTDSADLSDGSATLNFANLKFLFYLVIVGYGIGICVLMTEIIVHGYQKRRNT